MEHRWNSHISVHFHYTATRKFMVSNPEAMKQKAVSQERKRKRDEKKAASNGKKRKAHSSLDNPISSDSDDEKPATPITVYILIPRKPLLAATSSKSRSKASAADDTLRKGPFTLLSTDDYRQFLSKLALTLPCQILNIHESKLQWKSKKPANAPYLPLGGEAGYPAMITDMVPRKPADRVLLLSMPPPAAPMEDENVRHIHHRHFHATDTSLFGLEHFFSLGQLEITRKYVTLTTTSLNPCR